MRCGAGGMHRLCVALLGTAALAAGGCAGGEEDTTEDGPLTKAQFIARADAVCRAVKKAQQPYSDKVDELPEGTSIQRVAPLLEGALGESREGLARLRALRAPGEDRAALDAYYAAAEKLIEAHAQLAEAARTNDRASGETVARRTGALSEDERRLATEYGLQDCDDVF